MAYHDHPSHHRPTLRSSLDRLNHSVAALTASLEDLYHALDEVEQTDAQVLTFDFGTTSSTPAPAAAPARHFVSRETVPNVRRQWTNEENDLIIAGRKLGLNNAELGKALGRTVDGVTNQIMRLRKQGRL
jgi:hypothetical protein